jgi:pimeloyl-ACP methyl ester carboxylesterase
MALRAPERVSGLLALSIPHPWFETRRSPQAPLFASYQVLLSSPWIGEAVLRTAPAFVERLIAAAARRREHLGPQELARYSAVLRDPARAAASSALYRTFLLRENPRRGSLGTLTVPASVVVGTADPILRAVKLAPRPYVSVEMVPGAGHFLPEEAPDVVLEHARRLLDR